MSIVGVVTYVTRDRPRERTAESFKHCVKLSPRVKTILRQQYQAGTVTKADAAQDQQRD